MPKFEKFSRRAKPVGTQPFVTLQRRGTFSLNRAAYEKLGEPEYIEMLYDRTDRIVGFRPTTDGDPDAYPLRKQQNSYSYLIGGQAFCQFYGLETEGARRYPAEMIEDVLAIDLNGPSGDATGPRAKK